MSPPTKKNSPVAEHVRASLPKPEKDWPSEPDGDNPYRRCAVCHRPEPELSGNVHYVSCEWAQEQARRREALSMLDELLDSHARKLDEARQELARSKVDALEDAAARFEEDTEYDVGLDAINLHVSSLLRRLAAETSAKAKDEAQTR